MTASIARRAVIAAIVVLAAGYVSYRVFFAKRGPEYLFVEVRRGNVVENVSETGTVVAAEDLDLYFKNSGRVAKVLVKEGAAVAAGEPLMALDTGELKARRRESEAALASAQAKYAQALAGATAEDVRVSEAAAVNAETDLRSAEQALADTIASNEAGLDKTYADLQGNLESVFLKSSAAVQTVKNDVFDAAGHLKNDINVSDSGLAAQAGPAFLTAAASLTDMSADIDAVRAAADRSLIDALSTAILDDARTIRNAIQLANDLMQGSSPAGSTTQASFDARKANVKTAWTDLNSAVSAAESQKLLIASTIAANTAKENAARADVDAARGALQSARDQLALKQAPLREVDKAVYQAAIASARAGLELIDQQLEESTLAAPVDGVVGTVDLDVGELATPSAKALSLISRRLEIIADVSELDIGKLSVGGPLTATFDALGPQAYPGKIVKIAAREKKENEDIFYEVTAALDDENAPLKPGMTADVSIAVGERSGVLLAPKRLLIRRGGKTYVQVLQNGRAAESEVRVGLQGDDDAEILEGLKEGDRIISGEKKK